MSQLFIIFGVIVVLAALPHILAKITLELIAGIRCLLVFIYQCLGGILKGVRILAYTPVTALQDAYKGFCWLKSSYLKEFKLQSSKKRKAQREKNALKNRNAKRKAQTQAEATYDEHFFQFNAKLKELSEKSIPQQTSATRSHVPVESKEFDTPAFMRQGIFQVINGELCRDKFGNPIKTSVASLFGAVEKTSIQKPQETLTSFLSLVASAPIELGEDGFEPEFEPYLEIA